MFNQPITTKLLNKFDNQVDYIVKANIISKYMIGKNIHIILKKLKKSAQRFLTANQLSKNRIIDVNMLDATSDNSQDFLIHLYGVYKTFYYNIGDKIFEENLNILSNKLVVGDSYTFMLFNIVISDMKENMNRGLRVNPFLMQTFLDNVLHFDLPINDYSKGIVNETLIHNETKEVVKINLYSTKPQDLNLALVYSLLILNKLENDIKRN